MYSVLGHDGYAATGIASTRQLLQVIGPVNRADHPGMQQLPKFLEGSLVEYRQSEDQISAEPGIHVITIHKWRKAWLFQREAVPASVKDFNG